ncbi:MAG: DUF2059 domain-containing protein [Gammaproteobacteria bacterium]|nr:DUF2059 domain-containing protein [Gammaproteobacteria bacterium]
MKIFSILMLLLLSSFAHAGSYNDDLKRLFEITGIVNNYIGLNSQIINQMQAGFLRAADQSIDGSTFSDSQKKQAGELLKARFASMVKNYEGHIKKTMPYEKVITEIYLPLYKETYSPAEVKELLKFYESPIGKKTIEFNRSVGQEASKRTAEKYDSNIVSFVEAQIKDNIVIVKKEIDSKVR